MRIECHNCHKYLGNIKEGSQLRKGMVMLCRECGIVMTHEGNRGAGIFDMLKNITGGKT